MESSPFLYKAFKQKYSFFVCVRQNDEYLLKIHFIYSIMSMASSMGTIIHARHACLKVQCPSFAEHRAVWKRSKLIVHVTLNERS